MKTVDRGTRVVLKTILFVTDFSPMANGALCYATDLASRFGAKLVAVHAKGMSNYALPPETWHQEDEICQEEMERLRASLASSFPETNADIRVGEGLAWQVLGKIADESKADLIVTSSNGRGGVDRLLLGSQAEEIIRHAPCPVLTVGPQVPSRVTRPWKLSDILFATNFGPESRAAVAYAISLAEEHQARLTLLHVAEPPKAGDLVDASMLVTSLKNLLHEMVASKGFFQSYRLPATFSNRVVVGSEFFIRPLLPFAAGSDRFFVLALSQNHVRLFEGSRFEIRELTLTKTPENIREDFEASHFERETDFHTTTTPGHSASRRDKRGLVYHGAEPKPDRKERILHFFRDVEAGVAESLKGQNAPLVVATVDYLFLLYEKANTYAHLLEESISGNPDLLSPNALHIAAWVLVEKNMEQAQAKAFAVYEAHINSERTSTNVRKVVAEANSGHARFLFVLQGAEQWGSLAPPDTVHVHSQREPGDDELLNLAAVLTIRNGGRVFVVTPEKLPQGATVAAVFRF